MHFLPDPWKLVARELRPGDVVLERVDFVSETEWLALVEILHDASGIVHVSEVDWISVRNVSNVLSVGQVVAVTILKLDQEGKREDLSVSATDGSLAGRPSPSLVPGGLPFDWRAFARCVGGRSGER